MPTTINNVPPLLNHVSDLLNDGIVSIPSFISEDETQTLLDLMDENCWNLNGFEYPRRVQLYINQEECLSANDEEFQGGILRDVVHGDVNSLSWLIDKFMEYTCYVTKRQLKRPTQISIEERLSSTYNPTYNENISSSAFEFKERICSCNYCHSDELAAHMREQTNLCSCYVGYLTLLRPCTQFLNKPRRRDLDCWELETENHQVYLPMHNQSLVLKWGDIVNDWRYRILPSSNLTDECDRMNKRSLLIIFRNLQANIIRFNAEQSASMIEYPMLNTSISTVSSNIDLSKLLTIVVTTSPIRSHPSTELLERVFQTFTLAGNEFAFECSKIIVCDGYRILDEDVNIQNSDSLKEDKKVSRKHNCVKQALRSGIATLEHAENYKAFKIALRQLCQKADNKSPFFNTKIVELEERFGYGFALRNSLAHVETPFVCVIQHDRTFMRKTPVKQIVETMVNDVQQRIKYVGLSMRSNLMYRDIFMSKYGKIAVKELFDLVVLPRELVLDDEYIQSSIDELRVLHSKSLWDNLVQLSQSYKTSFHNRSQREILQRRSMSSGSGEDDAIGARPCSLTPTLFWYDNTHICRTEHYIDFVFSTKYKMVVRGGFVEDKLSPALIRTVEKLGLKDGHAKFGCYLLDDHSGFFYTGHLDGGNFLAGKEDRNLST